MSAAITVSLQGTAKPVLLLPFGTVERIFSKHVKLFLLHNFVVFLPFFPFYHPSCLPSFFWPKSLVEIDHLTNHTWLQIPS